jgi:hypothetical protein
LLIPDEGEEREEAATTWSLSPLTKWQEGAVQAEASAALGKWAVTVTEVTSLLVDGKAERIRGCTATRGCNAEALHDRKARKAAATAKRRGPRLDRHFEGRIGRVG